MSVNCRKLYQLLANLDAVSNEMYFRAVHTYNTHC